MIKWVAAFLGYYMFRIPGAVLGLILGILLENLENTTKHSGRSGGNVTRQTSFPGDFELNLIALCSIISKADGPVNPQELDYIQQYFLNTYGKKKADAILNSFTKILKKKEIPAQRVCTYMRQHTAYEVRIQLLHFLFGIAQADGIVNRAEASTLKEVSGYLHMKRNDFENIKSLFIKNTDNAYSILDLDREATDKDLKKAYRNMAKKYHPDRVVTQNETIRKEAEEKFKEIQQAYETIQKERGIY